MIHGYEFSLFLFILTFDFENIINSSILVIFQPTSSNQLQLVQGPDGQFILQSAPAPAPATPTILSQTVRYIKFKNQFDHRLVNFLAQGYHLNHHQPISIVF